MTENSLAVTTVNLIPISLWCSLLGPLNLCMPNGLKSYQIWSSSDVTICSSQLWHLTQRLWWGQNLPEKQITKTKEGNTEEAEATNVAPLGHWVSTSPASFSPGLVWFLAFLLLKCREACTFTLHILPSFSFKVVTFLLWQYLCILPATCFSARGFVHEFCPCWSFARHAWFSAGWKGLSLCSEPFCPPGQPPMGSCQAEICF